MAKKKKNTRKRKSQWSRLLVVEVLLAMGLVKEGLEDWVLGLEFVPGPVRILLGVAVVVTTLGGVYLVLQRWVQKALNRLLCWVQRVFSVPAAVAHFTLILLLFSGYGLFWADRTNAPAVVAQWAWQFADQAKMAFQG